MTKQDSDSAYSLTELARRHQAIFAEVFDGQLLEEDFQKLERDEKPAVYVELAQGSDAGSHIDFLSVCDSFIRGAMDLGYWVLQRETGIPDFFGVYISKLRSVASALQSVTGTVGQDHVAGAVGVLLGYPYKEVLDYAAKHAPHEFRRRLGTR